MTAVLLRLGLVAASPVGHCVWYNAAVVHIGYDNLSAVSSMRGGNAMDSDKHGHERTNKDY